MYSISIVFMTASFSEARTHRVLPPQAPRMPTQVPLTPSHHRHAQGTPSSTFLMDLCQVPSEYWAQTPGYRVCVHLVWLNSARFLSRMAAPSTFPSAGHRCPCVPVSLATLAAASFLITGSLLGVKCITLLLSFARLSHDHLFGARWHMLSSRLRFPPPKIIC